MKSSHIAAIAVVVVLCLWMASGLLGSDGEKQAETSDTDNASAPMKVEVTAIDLSPKSREIVLQGQLEPARRLMVRSETSGTVDSLQVSKGQRVVADDAIATLSLSGRDTELREARAMVRTAASEQQAAESLRKQGLQSQVQLEQAQARLETARAQLARIELDITNTRISAPFAGVINDLPVEVGELVERGGTVAELVDDRTLIMSAQAAQQTVAKLEAGQAVVVRLITGESLPGKLTFIASVASSQTRSFKVEAEVDNKNGSLAAGVSASLIVPVEQISAAFLSPSALSLGDDGSLGVKIVDEDNLVEFVPVSLVSTSLEGAWVTGIPENSWVITLGQGFVTAGQEVDPQPVADELSAENTDTPQTN